MGRLGSVASGLSARGVVSRWSRVWERRGRWTVDGGRTTDNGLRDARTLGLNIQHPTSNIQHPTSTGLRDSGTQGECRIQNVECRMQKSEKGSTHRLGRLGSVASGLSARGVVSWWLMVLGLRVESWGSVMDGTEIRRKTLSARHFQRSLRFQPWGSLPRSSGLRPNLEPVRPFRPPQTRSIVSPRHFRTPSAPAPHRILTVCTP